MTKSKKRTELARVRTLIEKEVGVTYTAKFKFASVCYNRYTLQRLIDLENKVRRWLIVGAKSMLRWQVSFRDTVWEYVFKGYSVDRLSEVIQKLKCILSNLEPELATQSSGITVYEFDEDTIQRSLFFKHKHRLSLQRQVKRTQRLKAEHSQNTQREWVTPEHDELLELELSFKERVSHRNGWGNEYRPTRRTWHRHDDNRCWKNKKCRKQYMVHVD